MKNSERTYIPKMLMNSKDKWKRSKTRDNKSSGKNYRLMRRPRLLWRSRIDSSKAMPKSA